MKKSVLGCAMSLHGWRVTLRLPALGQKFLKLRVCSISTCISISLQYVNLWTSPRPVMILCSPVRSHPLTPRTLHWSPRTPRFAPVSLCLHSFSFCSLSFFNLFPLRCREKCKVFTTLLSSLFVASLRLSPLSAVHVLLRVIQVLLFFFTSMILRLRVTLSLRPLRSVVAFRHG